MNSLRVDFTIPSSYPIRITPYWLLIPPPPLLLRGGVEGLLGFVEGDGSFYTRKNFALSFNIVQSAKDLVLMEAIRDYLNNLASLTCVGDLPLT